MAVWLVQELNLLLSFIIPIVITSHRVWGSPTAREVLTCKRSWSCEVDSGSATTAFPRSSFRIRAAIRHSLHVTESVAVLRQRILVLLLWVDKFSTCWVVAVHLSAILPIPRWQSGSIR